MWLSLNFCTQVVSTLAMLGLIWFVQLVHYPLFLRADPATFAAFEAEHARRVTGIAAPLMCLELGTALLGLLPGLRPPVVSGHEALLGTALVAFLWASTIFVQIPAHNRLHRGYNAHTLHQLIRGNWLRTLLWSWRAALITLWLSRLVHERP